MFLKLGKLSSTGVLEGEGGATCSFCGIPTGTD